jgi:hypothetical protein
VNPATRAERLNRNCDCESVGTESMQAFYSRAPVFIGQTHRRKMDAVITAVHRAVALPGFQQAVLAEAPELARVEPNARGVFAGFDFHVAADGPQLIEINTNAGGALINAAAEWRHPDCCNEGNPQIQVPATRENLEQDFIAMFRNEWRLARGDRPLKNIAIVDDHPEGQFLYPEFRLFEALFAAHGIGAFVTDAAGLAFSQGQLMSGDRVVDLVYNRLTDFYFTDASHAALRAAYLEGATVVTPHPRAHALLADKRNLVKLTDEAFLRSIGLPTSDIHILLAGIPRTRLVDGCADTWWRDRKDWFFKPAAGFGSRGAYRGDKITRRAFGDVVQGGYVAQQFAPPGERMRKGPDGSQSFKVDVRCYVYEGATQLLAARLYQGQTTNFRTAGGGFAPVIELLDPNS